VQATFIPSAQINSDLGVVNAARVSLNKKSEWSLVEVGNNQNGILKETDVKLIQYLAKHNHWTPFAHSRLYFKITWPTGQQELSFRRLCNLKGFEWDYYTAPDSTTLTIPSVQIFKGSLYAWAKYFVNVDYPETMHYIHKAMYDKYPVSAQALTNKEVEYFTHSSIATEMSEEYVIQQRWWNVACATLLVKVPIFVARQIRTSQVGIAYSDLYVEGESFVYNEVSRRYVNDEPSFYTILQWRMRKGKNVKQGSTGIASDVIQSWACRLQTEKAAADTEAYNHLINNDHIAPEQARCMLPQSMYTEFYMTATLHRWAQWLSLRLEQHVQEETRYIASRVLDELEDEYPTWANQYITKEMESCYIAP